MNLTIVDSNEQLISAKSKYSFFFGQKTKSIYFEIKTTFILFFFTVSQDEIKIFQKAIRSVKKKTRYCHQLSHIKLKQYKTLFNFFNLKYLYSLQKKKKNTHSFSSSTAKA